MVGIAKYTDGYRYRANCEGHTSNTTTVISTGTKANMFLFLK